MSANRDPLNRTSGPQIVRFFDICFKQGVLDAYNYGDKYGAKEFLNNHMAAWDFGVLGEPDDYDWEMWRFTLYRWARRNHLTSFAENYIFRISKKNYLWYLLPFCMRFYMLGIQEWLDYPQPMAIERFKQEKKVHWAPQENPSMRKITKNDFISYMQEFTYDYRRSQDNFEPDKRPMSVVTMDGYCQAIHDLTRKYDRGRKIKIKEEDV